MRGQVLGVDARTGDGMVSGDDGRRYSFRPADWADRGEPMVGMYVDFDIHESRALSIFPVPGTAGGPIAAQHGGSPVAVPGGNDRNKYVAAVVAFIVGPLGIHRFYLGRNGSGLTMLLLSCTLVGLFLTVPWALIDTVRYLIMSDREFAARYAREPG